MEVHRQTCQACGSIEVRNILVRAGRMPTTVYVRCTQCNELVARYELSHYYHHGKGLESYLRSRGVDAFNSGSHWQEEFQRAQREAVAGYESVLDLLTDEQKST